MAVKSQVSRSLPNQAFAATQIYLRTAKCSKVFATGQQLLAKQSYIGVLGHASVTSDVKFVSTNIRSRQQAEIN